MKNYILQRETIKYIVFNFENNVSNGTIDVRGHQTYNFVQNQNKKLFILKFILKMFKKS